MSSFLSSLRVAVSREIASFNLDLLMTFRGDFREWKTIALDLDFHLTPLYSTYHAVGFLRKVIKGLPRHIETIRVRAESVFFSRDMIALDHEDH